MRSRPGAVAESLLPIEEAEQQQAFLPVHASDRCGAFAFQRGNRPEPVHAARIGPIVLGKSKLAGPEAPEQAVDSGVVIGKGQDDAAILVLRDWGPVCRFAAKRRKISQGGA